MFMFLRRLVSKNKRRYQKDGFDLDLSYITPRIIAMGYPADEFMRGLYRNPMQEVVRFLTLNHRCRYMVYNLCIEDGYGYNEEFFGGRVVRIPLFDGQPSPLHVTLEFVKDAVAWLQGDDSNVVVVHCKAGKGRTGTLISALLAHLSFHHPHLLPSSLSSPSVEGNSSEATMQRCMAHYDTARTHNGRGLTIPSQKRSVLIFLNSPPQPSPPLDLPHPAPVKLTRLLIAGLPASITRDVTIALWERPRGCYGHKMISLLHCSGEQGQCTNGTFAASSCPIKSLDWVVERRWGTWLDTASVDADLQATAEYKSSGSDGCCAIRVSFKNGRVSRGSDIKLHLFRGNLLRELSNGFAVFNHPQSIFYTWFNLSEGAEGEIECGRIWREVDKLSKPLRKKMWPQETAGVILTVSQL